MGFGLVGKTPGVRLVTGSRYYGERTAENRNRRFRLFPKFSGGRSIMIVGLKAIIEVTAKKKTRKPTVKKKAV